jgi:predicted DCC family thiol-disulfide oxidoreductase YuxK
VFVKRGFRWLPMQTPGTALRLGMSEKELQSEMKVRLADGRVLGGVDAWASLLRSVWWLWPPGVLVGLPGVRTVSGMLYRSIARNRYRISKTCGLPNRLSSHRRHEVFFTMP